MPRQPSSSRQRVASTRRPWAERQAARSSDMAPPFHANPAGRARIGEALAATSAEYAGPGLSAPSDRVEPGMQTLPRRLAGAKPHAGQSSWRRQPRQVDTQIDAPPSAVWPWIAQMGPSPRGGAYTYDWIENLLGLDMYSADRVLPRYQHPKVGDGFSVGANEMSFKIVEPEHLLATQSAGGGSGPSCWTNRAAARG